MLILLRVWLSNEKIRQSVTRPLKLRESVHTVDLETKPAVVPAFIQFRLEFGETVKQNTLPTTQGIGI
jgi:hypothetical protein